MTVWRRKTEHLFVAAQAQIIFQTPRLKDGTAYKMIWTIQSGEQTVYITDICGS